MEALFGSLIGYPFRVPKLFKFYVPLAVRKEMDPEIGKERERGRRRKEVSRQTTAVEQSETEAAPHKEARIMVEWP